MSDLQSFKQLIVWRRSMELAEIVYLTIEEFPKSEIYGLISQMRRCAVSVPSNIAEGYGRKSVKEYGRFYSIAYGSLLELHTQILLSKRLHFITDTQLDRILVTLDQVSKMLHVMILKTKS